MPSITSLCCYRSSAVEQCLSIVERIGDATGDRGHNRIDHSAGLGHIETQQSHSSVSTECAVVARGSGSDSGMGSGRDRLDIGNRSLARRNTYITRQEWKRRHAGNPDRHGAEDDDLSLVSDPNSLYLGPLISVFSHNTETRAIPSPSETEEDAMQRFVSINTAVQSYAEERPTEQPTDIERAAAESPRAHQLSGKGYGVEKASPSRLTSVPLDDDSWSPFQIWLLTQTQGTGMSPSGENNANDILESNTTAINDTHDKMRPKKEDVPDPGRLQTSMDLSHSESQVFEERYPLSEASISSSKTRPYVADRVAHSSGAKYSRHDKGSSYSSGQITNSHANSPGRRDIHVSLSCRKLPHT